MWARRLRQQSSRPSVGPPFGCSEHGELASQCPTIMAALVQHCAVQRIRQSFRAQSTAHADACQRAACPTNTACLSHTHTHLDQASLALSFLACWVVLSCSQHVNAIE